MSDETILISTVIIFTLIAVVNTIGILI